jgi:hypothetical protein
MAAARNLGRDLPPGIAAPMDELKIKSTAKLAISYPVMLTCANNADIRITIAPVVMTSRPANKRRIGDLHYAKL